MADPLILYSVNSWLAYIINERYYGGEHFVWCAPVFDVEAQSRAEVPVERRAAPLSREFLIARLPRRCFDVIEF
jgi:hypothetical protein